MAWTYSQLQTEIQNEVDDDSSDGLTVIKQFINDISREIWQRHPWPFRSASTYLSTTDGDATYDLSSLITDLLILNTVGYKGSGENDFILLDPIDVQRFNNLYHDRTNESRPVKYCFYNNILNLWPMPDYTGSSNLEVTYDKLFTELTGNNDVPAIPEHWKAVIKAGVKALFFDYDDDTRAAGQKSLYEQGLRDMAFQELVGDLAPKRVKLFRP